MRVGRVDGAFVANPTVEQMESSDLDLMLAGTSDAVLMIEGFCEFLSDAEMVEVRNHVTYVLSPVIFSKLF